MKSALTVSVEGAAGRSLAESGHGRSGREGGEGTHLQGGDPSGQDHEGTGTRLDR